MRKILILFTLLIIIQLSCTDFIVQSPELNQNFEDFEFAWNAINDVYPLLDYKKIDWDSIYTVYSLRTKNVRGDEFYQILFDLLWELKDPHVYFLNNGRGLIFPYPGIRYIRDMNAYSPLVVRRYFNSELQLACRDKVEYGIHSDNIGYIYIATFNDEGLLDNFDTVVDFVIDTKGLIMDVRRNTGGSTNNIEKVMRCFIDSPLEYFQGYTKGDVPFNKDPIQPKTDSPKYEKPVVVLINGATISGGEVLAELMNHLPTVTIVGDTTNGAGCNDIANDIEGDYFLPSGKYIHIGTTYWIRYDGVPFEWNGIPPEIRVIQTESDIINNRDKQLEYAIELLK